MKIFSGQLNYGVGVNGVFMHHVSGIRTLISPLKMAVLHFCSLTPSDLYLITLQTGVSFTGGSNQ